MMPYYVYILYSSQLKKFYVGPSSDPHERLRRHLSNHKGFTSVAKDRSLIYQKAFDEKADAISFEKEIKGWKVRKE